MLTRFTHIFWYYFLGPLLGLNQKLWPSEKRYCGFMQVFSVLIYVALLGIFIKYPMGFQVRVGMALILFSPQWLYVLPLPHSVFEFRGYGMAAGVAILASRVLYSHPLLVVSLLLFWAWQSYVRRSLLTNPMRFWQRVQEDNKNG